MNDDALFELVCDYIDGDINDTVWQAACSRQGQVLGDMYQQELATRAALGTRSTLQATALPLALADSLATITHAVVTPAPTFSSSAETAVPASQQQRKRTLLTFPVISACVSVAAAVLLALNIGTLIDSDTFSTNRFQATTSQTQAHEKKQRPQEHTLAQATVPPAPSSPSDDTAAAYGVRPLQDVRAIPLFEVIEVIEEQEESKVSHSNHTENDQPTALHKAKDNSTEQRVASDTQPLRQRAKKRPAIPDAVGHARTAARSDDMDMSMEAEITKAVHDARLHLARHPQQHAVDMDTAAPPSPEQQHAIIQGLLYSSAQTEEHESELRAETDAWQAHKAPMLNMHLTAHTAARHLIIGIRMNHLSEPWLSRAIKSSLIIAYDRAGLPVWTSSIVAHTRSPTLTELHTIGLPPASAVSMHLQSLGQSSNSLRIAELPPSSTPIASP